MTTNQTFYSHLSELRELFHKYGRFDDSNAKLEEIAKYIAIHVYQLQSATPSDLSIRELLRRFESDDTYPLVPRLKELFHRVAGADEFRTSDNSSIFGNQPSLQIDDKDNRFAYALLKLVVTSVESVSNKEKSKVNFDLLNESFGHFVRDNFRNHIEDAQYMTPPEAVELMCSIAVFDLKKERTAGQGNEFVLCDPCCGVGSFLSAFYKKNKEDEFIDPRKLTLVGQDKVARMVRLAHINMLMLGSGHHTISSGNSLVGDSILNHYQGKVDLILTNPPFGAKFASTELRANAKLNYPLLHDLILNNGSNFSSETLFLDRCLSLLKPHGKLLIVLPDGVISSAGLNATLRHRLAMNRHLRIRGIVELPAVAFAQAGTRTKTSILYIEKIDRATNDRVFIAKSEQIGFEVSTRKGATIKKEVGTNDLVQIVEAYRTNNHPLGAKDHKVISETPSCVIISPRLLEDNSWTPSHFHAQRFHAIDVLKSGEKDVELVRLIDIAEFKTKERRLEYISHNSKCISVLHVVSGDDLNLEELLTYKPKYPGIPCKPGELLFSKINPRIPRALVVPDLDFPLTCSTEFEIIDSRTEINNYGVKLLLMLPSVQAQINHLTSGTSSSHNRIKSTDLANILVPVPKRNTKAYKELVAKSKEYEKKHGAVHALKFEITNLKRKMFELVS
ncbi:MAG: N-6 DNA methylase [Candidatus Brennerbacteria bacterium]